jgi:hypothetical protein
MKAEIRANNEKFEVLKELLFPGWISTKSGQSPLKKK